MANRSGFALGRKPADHYRKALKFSNFLKEIPDHPLEIDDSPDGMMFDMDMNDRVGICVPAGFDHFRQICTRLLTGTEKKYSYNELLNFYKTQNPNFDIDASSRTVGPGSGADQGMRIQTFLEYLQKNGHILGFAKIDTNSPEELKAAIYLGLGILIGVDLQMSQQSQTVWDYNPSEEWGGHCVTWDGYGKNFVCVTWGEEVLMTYDFVFHQCDEAWFIILPEHVEHPEFRAGFDLSRFAKAFTSLTGRPFPVSVLPTPTPSPALPEDRELIRAGDAWKPSILSRWTKAGKLRTAFEEWKRAHGY